MPNSGSNTSKKSNQRLIGFAPPAPVNGLSLI